MVKKKANKNDGFTLLELLIVATVLAVIAGGAILTLGDQQDDASLKISHKEILDIKKAVLQFKRDTGYLPKQGPFALGIGCSAPGNPAEEKFCSPANFEQLYENPDILTGDPQEYLENWNPDTSRGWRGPYLTRLGEGLVDVSNDINPHKAGIGGDPEKEAGSTLLDDLRGIADAFIASRGNCPVNDTQCFLGFSTVAGDSTHSRWGRPYFLFGLESTTTDDDMIIGMGPDKAYGTGDDIVLELFK